MNCMNGSSSQIDSIDSQDYHQDLDLFADAPPLKSCDGCGKYFEETDLKKCRICGKYFCPECRKTHDCRIKPQKNPPESVPMPPHPRESPQPLNSEKIPLTKPNLEAKIPPEKEVRIRKSATCFIGPCIILAIGCVLIPILWYGILIAIPCAVLFAGLIYFMITLIRYIHDIIIITPSRIIIRDRRVHDDIQIDKLDGTQVRKKRIIIHSVGGYTYDFGPVRHPFRLQKLISDYIEHQTR